ncbi:MAG: ketol-acid reductoisomerase [Phycisphaerales bacterium]|nr:ketol-acid reductoisomerase [Phycisphaerales bacterium]
MNIIRGVDQAPLTPLENRVTAVLGFGNQGAAHALNLRDSGLDVVVGNRADSANGRRCRDAGFAVRTLEEATAAADLVIIGLPDDVQPDVLPERVIPHLRPGATVGFIHGFAVRYRLVDIPPAFGIIMVAPKGPGATLRARYLEGYGLPCLFAVEQDNASGTARELALAWGAGLGGATCGLIEATFADETETDLFGEQAVLCGGMTALIVAAFETLVDAGYPPELAYIECCHEVKQVADLVFERGLAGMRKAISTTAEFGAYAAGPRVVNDDVRDTLRALLAEIRDGTFARSMRADSVAGARWSDARRREGAAHPIESAGATVRSLLPWLDDASAAQSSNTSGPDDR